MKYLFFFLMFCGVSFFAPKLTNGKPPGGDCAMAVTYAEMAFKNFKKAYKASTMDEAKKQIETGVKQAAQSAAYAIIPDCDCANAKNYALNAVTFGNKAKKAAELKLMKELVKQAMDASVDVLTAVPGCKK